MDQYRAVITGLGAITPIGNSAEAYWQALVAGTSGGGRISHFDASDLKVTIACEVKGYDAAEHFDAKTIKSLDPFVQFALVAARDAMRDSGLRMEDVDPTMVGVLLGTGIGGIQTFEEQYSLLRERGAGRVSPRFVPKFIGNMGAGRLAMEFGCKGPNLCVVSACATGTHAIGEAYKLIASGEATAMLAGGAEAAITPLALSGFANSHALSKRNDTPATASRPFSRDRDGFVMGEGAGVMVIEEYEHARARGAQIYAEIVGYGQSSDAYHETAPDPDGLGLQRAITLALKRAGLTATDISCVCAHGTGTALNDKTETLALKAVLGEHSRQTPVFAVKSQIGHLCGAAGAVEGIASAYVIRDGIIPPTINYTEADPECDLDYVTEGARRMPVQRVLKTSCGFGGHNACLIFSQPE